MTGAFRFEGRRIAFDDGDTIAIALHRAGVRTLSRSLKHHRRRGLYCGTGDCPNCLMTVDGIPGVHACRASCRDGMRVRREGGWPSAERDLLHVTDSLHRLMPVGFYYKAFIRPRFAWAVAERVIRRATGVGRLPLTERAARQVVRHVHVDVLVIGGGESGVAAARDAAEGGVSVLLCDEGPVEDLAGVTVLPAHTALGIFEGLHVPLAGDGVLVHVHPGRVIVATGATERHGVFPGNDLLGVMLGRAASGLASRGVKPGDRAVVAVATEEGLAHLDAILGAGVEVAAVAVTGALADQVPTGVGEIVVDGEIHAAHGRETVQEVVVRRGTQAKRFAVDLLVCSMGLAPRDGLARMALPGEPVSLVGDAALPAPTDACDHDGVVCLCEDVSRRDLAQAWDEGFRSAELLKRYTTVTMGPCQGAMCGNALACFARERGEPAREDGAASRTTARPPARPVTLESLAAGVHELVDKRTSLHDLHVEAGARLDRSGGWLRPFAYGDWREEYRAVRERVSLMDVGTLGKFTIAGPDAGVLVDRLFPCRTDDLAPGRTRYVLTLDDAGYVMDDGLLARVGEDEWYLNSTTGGAGRTDARLRNFADRFELDVHLLDRTAQWGAINVAGPHARELLERLTDDPIDATSLPYPGFADVDVAGVTCRAIRTGFVGELAFELHHPRSRGPRLWRALAEAGREWDLLPHGLDALELLRLEKGHIYLGQDTMPDDTPTKLRMPWAVDMEKPWFVGKRALERMSALPPRRRSFGLSFEGVDGDTAALRGEPLLRDGIVIGRVTSAERSPAVDAAIGLGWIRAVDGDFPERLSTGSGAPATVVPTPFYDPEGVRLRG
ncbi:MAG TPA: 2Fe-2S iron-sulfur cluster-binding protein [Actinomycetota bacterium]